MNVERIVGGLVAFLFWTMLLVNSLFLLVYGFAFADSGWNGVKNKFYHLLLNNRPDALGASAQQMASWTQQTLVFHFILVAITVASGLHVWKRKKRGSGD